MSVYTNKSTYLVIYMCIVYIVNCSGGRREKFRGGGVKKLDFFESS